MKKKTRVPRKIKKAVKTGKMDVLGIESRWYKTCNQEAIVSYYRHLKK